MRVMTGDPSPLTCGRFYVGDGLLLEHERVRLGFLVPCVCLIILEGLVRQLQQQLAFSSVPWD